MKSSALYIIFAGLSAASILAGTGCASKSERVVSLPAPPAAVTPAAAGRQADVSHLVADDLTFAKDFVQALSDAGWVIREVHHSKFNGFFPDARKAAFIRTDRGVIEAIFFESEDSVKQISVSEEHTGNPQYHRYAIRKAPLTDQRLEGGACYFTKYRNAFIITTDSKLNDAFEHLPL